MTRFARRRARRTAQPVAASRTRQDEIIANIKAMGNRPVIGVEVGVWSGETAASVMAECENVTLHLVDRYRPPAEGDSHYDSGSVFARADQEFFDKGKQQMLSKLGRYLMTGRAMLHESASLDAVREFDDESVDYVFVDADHSYAGCLADLKAWWPKVKPGGFIAGHDYGSDKFPGVKQAWDEMFPGSTAGCAHTVFHDRLYNPSVTIGTVCFAYPGEDVYLKLRDAWRKSIGQVMPDATIVVKEIDPPCDDDPSQRRSWCSNLAKTEAWRDLVREHKGRDLILMDCDMIVLRDVSAQFADEFDLTFTERPHVHDTHEPINTGFMAVRCNDRTIKFFDELCEVARWMYDDEDFHAPYWSRYRGIMQAALGHMMESGAMAGLDVRLYPCSVYNVSDHEYLGIGSDARVVHYKAGARKRLGKKVNGGRYKLPLGILYRHAPELAQEVTQ